MTGEIHPLIHQVVRERGEEKSQRRGERRRRNGAKVDGERRIENTARVVKGEGEMIHLIAVLIALLNLKMIVAERSLIANTGITMMIMMAGSADTVTTMMMIGSVDTEMIMRGNGRATTKNKK